MKNVTKLFLFGSLSLSLAAVACSDDETTTPPPTTTTSSGTGAAGGGGGDEGGGGATGGGIPDPPTLGAQLDRMGRPAINTAANDRFSATHDTSADAWNEASDPSMWATEFLSNVTPSLAVYDSLDEECYTVATTEDANCVTGGDNATCYGTIGTVVVQDWLVIKATGADEPVYMGVEANFTGLLANDSRGGRKTEHDVIATSYTVLAGLDLATPFDDGVTAPAQAMVMGFPYLAEPNQ